MPRNLDMAALRSLVAVADKASITAAAEQMNLTQSAVSMQIKRLEGAFAHKLLQRKGRGVVLTPIGEQLVSYARRLVALHDEAWTRLTNDDYEGEIDLGVPVDVVQPEIPQVLRRCQQLFPRIHVNLISSLTHDLRARLDGGNIDIILTTEYQLGAGGETLLEVGNEWFGARGGTAHLRRPLPLSMCRNCAMRPTALKTLDDAGIAWVDVGDTDSEITLDAIVSADLSVSAKLRSNHPHCLPIADSQLPVLPDVLINMYCSPHRDVRMIDKIATVVREVFSATSPEVGVASR